MVLFAVLVLSRLCKVTVANVSSTSYTLMGKILPSMYQVLSRGSPTTKSMTMFVLPLYVVLVSKWTTERSRGFPKI